ncbi:hypothetical protein B0T19DRAFT_419284 [Cercophora scortea]|uniref:Uncharacterized protein n=1 Tax=Cercophora scortea TaxID=314031 RepID=A0AAE0MJY2_9PEZI|nr:hypothetical protein B0T19DRAFT_419284 [Cercophora scortea]
MIVRCGSEVSGNGYFSRRQTKKKKKNCKTATADVLIAFLENVLVLIIFPDWGSFRGAGGGFNFCCWVVLFETGVFICVTLQYLFRCRTRFR